MNEKMLPPENEADANELAKLGAAWLRMYGVPITTEYGAAQTTGYPTEWRSWCTWGDYRFDIYRKGDPMYDDGVLAVKVCKMTPDNLRSVWFDSPIVIDTRMPPFASDGIREQITEALKRVDAAAEQEAKAIVADLDEIQSVIAPVSPSALWDEKAPSLHALRSILIDLRDLVSALTDFSPTQNAQSLMVKQLGILFEELALWVRKI